MNTINLHGDITLYPVNIKTPQTAKKSKIHILQASETTGNRHEVVSKKYPIFKWTKNGHEYISCKEDYIIQHVGGDCEHGVQNVEKGTREILREMEHDPWKNELRVVLD